MATQMQLEVFRGARFRKTSSPKNACVGGYTTGKPNKMTQTTGMATQMQRKKLAWPPVLLERKRNNNKVVSF